jgi:HSP20 family protein
MSQQITERRDSTVPERRQPLRELEVVTDRLREILDGGFGGVPALAWEAAAWSPMVDIEEQDDAYIVEADLAGAKREDVNVELSGSELVIAGEIKEKQRTGILRRRTRRVGRFDYRVTLPGQIDADNVNASLNEGVLSVRLPKSERTHRKRITVQGAGGRPDARVSGSEPDTSPES